MAPSAVNGVIGAVNGPCQSTAGALPSRDPQSRDRNIRAASEGRGWAAHTAKGTIRTNNVVIAAGYRSDAVAQTVGVPFSLSHRPIYVAATEPCSPFIEHLLYHTELRLTLKQAANGNVIIGGGWPATADPVYGRPAVLHDSLRRSLWVA
jgi:glycine/D-amino acid oxidase-like deaminating enzyme